MKVSIRLNGLRKVVFAALIGIFAIGAWQTVSAKENPNENFLSSVFGSISNLFTENNNRQTTIQNKPVFDDQVIGTCDTAGPIEIESTGGVTVPTAYANLKAAFDAINAGTHTGAINVEVCGNSVETTSAVLNSTGAGASSYTAVSIRPLLDGLSISGATVTGRGLIELNGADNVTIDGDNPNTAGTNRNLTLTNTAANTITYTSVIRIALATTIVTSADNDTFKNLIINGSATGRNIAAATSTTGTENLGYGIIATGGASTVNATTAPSAIASTTTTIGTGATATNLVIDNNTVTTAARAVAVQGAATTVFPGLMITNNVIGNPTVGAVDGVYSFGITAQGSTNANISSNTVYVESFIATSIRGIDTGSISATGSGFTINGNRVNRVQNNTTGGQGAYGINITSGNGHTVRNNFVSGVINVANATFSTTFGAFGIRIGAGTGHFIYHNSVNMYGNLSGTGAAATAALVFASTATTGIDARNNILVNTQTETGATTPASSAFVSIMFSSSTLTNTYNLTLNNNDYYIGATPAVNNGYGQAGTTAGTGFFTTFDSTMTTPASNLRSYTSTLSAAGTNDNASKAVNPQYVSNTDLHIAVASPVVDMGASVGVAQDIDGQNRVPPPDIGADEPSGATPLMNDIAATAIVNPPNGSSRGAGIPFTPQASYTNVGTSAQTNVTVRFRILNSLMVEVYNQTATIASIAPNATLTVSFPAATIATVGSYTTIASVELVGDQNTANDSVQGTLNIIPTFSGSYNVGTGETITSLTNTGGIFDQINSAGATGNITINITSDLMAETGTVALNEVNGGFTVTIKPSGAARTVSGTSATAIIRLNDADNVTVDGSLTGGTAGDVVGGDASLRNLTIQNNSTSTASAVVLIGSNTNGAQNNTVKNTNISGNDPLTTLIGISIGSGSPGGAGVDNDGNRVENCSVQKSVLGIYDAGASAANPNTTNIITKNDMSATTTNRVQRGAILIFNQDTAQITLNSIGGINGAVGIDHYGIAAGLQDVNTTAATNGGITNTTISRNRINGVVSTSSVGFSAFGIGIAGGTTGANTIANNMISGVTSPATSPDIVAGIFVASVTGSNTKVYFNSVSMTGDRSATVTGETPSYAMAYTADVALELKDNIFYTTQISSGGGVNAKSYAIGTAATTFVNLDSNFNDFWSTGANDGGFRSGSLTSGAGTDYATLAAWQTATAKDANSEEVDPLFVSDLTDLHLQAATPLDNDGTPVAGITVDIDGNPRSATTPEIGADELFVAVPGTLQFSSATYSVGEAGGTVTLTVTRTGGTDGAVTVDYALGGGTATGGASCGGAVDYVNTGGTVSFANGEASKTFTVAICNDALFEGNETFNATLSNATGGSTIGTPNPATVTIVDDEVAQPGTLQFSSATYSVGEAGGSVTLTVNRTGGSDGAVTVNYSLASGTATGGASCGAGVDFVNTGGTINFANGQTSQTITVTICDDAVFEGNENFSAALSGATGGAVIGNPGTATVTITDNETANPGTVALSSATYTVNEGDGVALITVNRTGGSDGQVSVNLTQTNGTAIGGPSCANGPDYMAITLTFTFQNGETTKTFGVPICDDTIVEGNEFFTVQLTQPFGGVTIGSPSSATVTIVDNDTPAGPVTVTATAGTATATYNNLTEAAAAINAGTHQGAIVVNINQTITEPGTVVINGSGAGAAAYTSLLIRPTVDNISDSGASVQGRGLIELNGADNVTIDGDNPNSGGTNRNLTLQNTAANTVTFTSVIRVAVAITGVTSADNNTFRNLNILGSATGRNIATATSTTGSENTTFGIFAGPGASTTDGTAAPAAITSVSTGVAAGATAANLAVSNNTFGTAARAVSINGSATSVFPGLQIRQNVIGNATAGDADQVYSIGVTAQGSLDAMIADNTIWIEGYIASSAATHGINVGVNSTAITGATIERNKVNRVRNSNGTTWSAFGINLGGGSSHIVRNNFVSGVLNSQTAGTGGFGTTFGAYGIRIASGTGHFIYHNSVNLYGMMPGVTSTNLTASFLITATTLTGIDVRNNIFSNQITGGNPAGTRNVAIFLPSAGTSAMNLTLNNNAYYVGTDANNRLAQVGTTFGTGEYTAANFDPTQTTLATNFRAYSSTLSAAGTNDNASFATTAPPFVSNTDLHIPASTATRLESGGANVGVLTDIDLENRNVNTPDIGADEFAGSPPPANDIAAVAFVNPVNGATISVGQTFTPQASFTNNGTVTQTNVTVRYVIVNNSTQLNIYDQTAVIPSIAPLQTVVVSFPATSLPAPGTYTIRARSELVGDQNPANDTIIGMITAVSPITGTINVGTGQTYTSLTNPGGVFEALNTAGISGNVVINITSDLTAETGTVALNQLAEVGAGGYTVTFKPSGAPRVISGTSATASGLIILNGADRIIFDGSLSGGTDRSLTITNNQATTGIVIWMRSPNASNGANNNTVRNCIINGAPGPNSTTVAGILTGSSVTLGGDAEAPNSNNTIQNNWIYRVQNSLYLRGGATAAVFDQNWMVVGNELGSTVTNDKNIFRGMLIGNSQNFTITRNLVHGIQSTTTTTGAMSGIQVALLVNTGSITRNNITDIKNVSTTGTGAFGVNIGSSSTASNVTIANNFVSDVAATGSATVISNGFGMAFIGSGTGYNVYYNSVNMNTNQTTAQTSAAVYVGSTFATAGALDFRNNIFANTQTTGTRYAVYSAAAATVFTTINYNDYFAQNVGFIGGVARPTLADWQTGTGQDANSKAVDPLFVSATDLHIQAASPVQNMATPIAAVTDDIDGEPRSATTPDIGADEVAGGVPMPGTLQFSSPTYSIGEAGGTATITVTRTGGSDGTVTVNYATGGGTATGGASCGGAVDYISTNGTLTFAPGVTSQTFNVTICNDAAFEGNETFNTTLSTATGGATIGSPNPATVTIVDDDSMPTVTSFSINDVKVIEGNSGTATVTFTVTASPAPSATATVNYSTANGTATAGSDYVATSGTLTFNAGDTTKTISVTINGDTIKEQNEFFFVNLSGASVNASITDSQGVGILIDEDRAYLADYDRDLKTDFSVYRPSNSVFYVSKSTKGFPIFQSLGQTGDVSVPGDYDNDGKTDFAVWRASTGSWLVLKSSDNTMLNIVWGTSGDKPVQGDYNGDGQTDYAVYRPSQGTWYILPSSTFTPYGIQFGISTDRLVQADYDGDFKTDIAVYRDGTWYILRSSDGAVSIVNWGLAADKPVIGDFDCDGRNDLAVYRNGFWYILNSLTNTATVVNWGVSDDIPVPADFDGNGGSDIAIFRPSTGDWYILRNPTPLVFHWGQNGDVPSPAAYLPQ